MPNYTAATKPQPPRVKYFFDTEFVEYQDRVIPVSLGIVSESGRTFYAEYNTDWRACASEWVLRNVAPYLEGNPQSLETIREELKLFVGEMPCEFWAYFAATDWVVMCHTMGRLVSLPDNWQPFVMDLAWLDPTLERIRSIPAHNLKPHHALWDALELRTKYQAITGKGL